jgi:hypothetical protein
MKKTLFILALAASVSAVSAQTKPAKKASESTKKECCKKKEGASCCSPSSKAKAVLNAKPAAEKKS